VNTCSLCFPICRRMTSIASALSGTAIALLNNFRNMNAWLQADADRRMVRNLDGILRRLEGARFESVELTDTKM
jgi:hypothetical protein